jgi:dienelactone hydrolase
LAARVDEETIGVHGDGTMWRWVCGLADRARVFRVPPPALVGAEEGPLSERDCLDPRCLEDPDRLYPAPPALQPEFWETIDQAHGVEVERLAFASHAPFGIPANDRVPVRFYRPAGRPPVASLLVLHGIWRQDQDFEDRLCRDLARHGVSCALLSLPFHWERAPAGSASGAYFMSGNPVWTSAAFRQALIDGRAVLGLLRGRGVPVGVLGFSLGGIIAHILMALERVDFGISTFAGGNTAGIVWEGVLTRPYRRAMEQCGVTLDRLSALWASGNPTLYAHRKPGRLLMLNAMYDLCVPPRYTHELWQALGQPPIRWLPAGHITGFFFRPTIVAEVLAALGLPRPEPAPSRLGFRRQQARARTAEVRWAA